MADTVVVAYRNIGGGERRPYLVLHIVGITGQTMAVPGLIDSGADTTVLPTGYAPLLGYTPADFDMVQGRQVGGSLTMRKAKKPCKAFIPELANVVFDLNPSFVEGSQTPIWGRKDLFRRFDIAFMENAQQFALTAV